MAEGYLGLREAYDTQTVFASKVQMTVKTGSDGVVTCKPENRFPNLCMHTDALGSFGQSVPKGVKANRKWYGNSQEINYPSYDASTGICASGGGSGWYTDLRVSGIGSSPYVSGPNWYADTDPGYFNIRAKTDQNLANEHGIAITDATMIWAIADLDGDHDSTSYYAYTACWIDPFNWSDITILGRGIYYKDGELMGSAGIVEGNMGE